MLRFFTKGFARWLIYGLPLSLFFLLIPSGDRRSWYDEGCGWPLFYGWRATDLRPRPLPTIEDGRAFAVDVFASVALFLTLSYLVRLLIVRSQQSRCTERRDDASISFSAPPARRR